MQSAHSIDTFEGGAFYSGFGKKRVSGTIHVSPSGLRFVSEQTAVELPWHGLTVAAGGANDRLLFFHHADFPDLSIYTGDQRILKHPCLADSREMQPHLGRIRSQKRQAKAVATVVLLALAGLVTLLFLGKDRMVQNVARQVPVEWESKIGDTVMGQLRVRTTVVSDPELNRQLQEIPKPLMAALKNARYEFKFTIIEDEEVNAFALPGGNLAVHTGLLLKAESPEEVAGVLAHELAHVTRQHGLRNLIESVGLYALVQAFFGDVTGLMAVLVNNTPFLLTQKFSRNHEREADEQGWDYLVAAGVNPQGMISFFKKLEQEQAERKKKDPFAGVEESLVFLSSHPATGERIEWLEQRKTQLDRKNQESVAAEFNLNFQEFQNSLRNHLNQSRTGDEK